MTLFLIPFFLGWGDRADRGGGDLQRVSAFKEPQARARTTLVGMAAIMAFLFIGITFLATRDARPFADGNPTLVAQLARHVLDNPAAFIAIQVATLLILVLAANTSFSSFPLLASFAADDAILPRQLRKRGHRLVYSNGILVLSAAAVFLVIAFRADTTTSSRCTPLAWSPPSPCPRRAWPGGICGCVSPAGARAW